MILLLLILLLSLVLLYIKGSANKNYFKDRNIPYLKPSFLLGNMRKIFSHPNSFLGFAMEMTQFENESRYVYPTKRHLLPKMCDFLSL